MGNLLNNACKFTDEGGRITLSVADESGQALICVRDTGIGIAADDLPRLFDMFVQVDSSLERSRDGLGIGLTLVKTLVEMHGGTVDVHSDGLGCGTEFMVRLPLSVDVPRAVPTPAITEPAATARRRILIVDDSDDGAESLAMLLELAGHETHKAYDGLEAIEAARRLRPDAVLLDIGLPRLNGYEVCRRMRQEPWGKERRAGGVHRLGPGSRPSRIARRRVRCAHGQAGGPRRAAAVSRSPSFKRESGPGLA